MIVVEDTQRIDVRDKMVQRLKHTTNSRSQIIDFLYYYCNKKLRESRSFFTNNNAEMV